jgi:hypothetical protein
MHLQGGILRQTRRFENLTLRQFLDAVGADSWEDLLEGF